MLNLNLGSGTSRKLDFVSVDLYTPEADLGIDLTAPMPWKDDEVDNIYACHVVEHFSRDEWKLISAEWARVLKPGGTLEIFCPDFVKVIQKYLAEPDNDFILKQIYGLQINDGEYHKNGFTEKTLTDSFPTLKAKVLPPSEDTELHMLFTKE